MTPTTSLAILRALALVGLLLILASLPTSRSAPQSIPATEAPILGGESNPARPTGTPATGPVSPSPAAVSTQPTAHVAASVPGVASWFAYRPGDAAAGPALRVGEWRGRLVRVCAALCIEVRLTGWCQCYGTRLVDLDWADFARLARVSRGLVRVVVTW